MGSCLPHCQCRVDLPKFRMLYLDNWRWCWHMDRGRVAARRLATRRRKKGERVDAWMETAVRIIERENGVREGFQGERDLEKFSRVLREEGEGERCEGEEDLQGKGSSISVTSRYSAFSRREKKEKVLCRRQEGENRVWHSATPGCKIGHIIDKCPAVLKEEHKKINLESRNIENKGLNSEGSSDTIALGPWIHVNFKKNSNIVPVEDGDVKKIVNIDDDSTDVSILQIELFKDEAALAIKKGNSGKTLDGVNAIDKVNAKECLIEDGKFHLQPKSVNPKKKSNKDLSFFGPIKGRKGLNAIHSNPNHLSLLKPSQVLSPVRFESPELPLPPHYKIQVVARHRRRVLRRTHHLDRPKPTAVDPDVFELGFLLGIFTWTIYKLIHPEISKI
ncbi:hypothetical protein MA16_Dca018463 [Dendrobium catenatum]|uniref:Uncharacterized protein n=1 Tax=Dendrobium catenatum TaxID=906689 RepID=A0A2I0X7G5_9ASPA|nr:hypothetical protein MA16_Dca018463 [Dendrobium catenatum]